MYNMATWTRNTYLTITIAILGFLAAPLKLSPVGRRLEVDGNPVREYRREYIILPSSRVPHVLRFAFLPFPSLSNACRVGEFFVFFLFFFCVLCGVIFKSVLQSIFSIISAAGL